MEKFVSIALALIIGLSTAVAAQDEYQHHEDALAAGAEAPMFALPNGDNEMIELADALESGPALVFFYRGNWCPFCEEAMKDVAARIDEIKATGVTVIAISPQKLQYSAERGSELGGQYHVLSDTEMKVAEAFGLDFTLDEKTKEIYKGYGIQLQEVNATEEWRLPVPGYFVIDTDGTIVWSYANEDYKIRPDVDMILAAIKKAKE